MIILTLMCSCMVRDPLQVREVPVRLVRIERVTRYPQDHLVIYWNSYDEKIKMCTEAALEDSSRYFSGQHYTALLPR